MPKIVEAGIDYLAASMPADLRNIQDWERSCREVMKLIADHGNVTRLGSFQGYDGLHVAGAFTGSRDDGVHIHVPGSWAGRVYSSLHRDGLRYSRLDLQVTLQFDEYLPNYGKEQRLEAAAHNRTLPEKRRRKIRANDEEDGGYTLYIGSRDSEHFCRVYDKAAQSGDPAYERCWRFEIQLHGKTATDAAQYIWVAPRGQAEVACSTVWKYFRDRGITPPWEREHESDAVLPQHSPKTDYERKLIWLREQVRPTIRLLREMGDEGILLEALGLRDDPAQLPPESSMV